VSGALSAHFEHKYLTRHCLCAGIPSAISRLYVTVALPVLGTGGTVDALGEVEDPTIAKCERPLRKGQRGIQRGFRPSLAAQLEKRISCFRTV
jgi:hypothetical protein